MDESEIDREFASPFLKDLFPEKAGVVPYASRVSIAKHHTDQVIESYPVFEGFHRPNFLKGQVFRSNKPPSLDAVRKFCTNGMNREIGFYRYQDQWLIVVGKSDTVYVPLELQQLHVDGVISLVAHTHPDTPASLLPSIHDVEEATGPEFIYSSQGVTRYCPPDPAFLERVKKALYFRGDKKLSLEDIAGYYIYDVKNWSDAEIKGSPNAVMASFFKDVCGLQFARWDEPEKIKALAGDNFTYPTRARSGQSS